MTIKTDTINGFKWSFIDTACSYFLTFWISIILARLLSPADYGLIGIVGIFMTFSRVFIDAGFSDALVRKIDCTKLDYSSVFVFNFVAATFFYAILFFAAPSISFFFNENQLVDLIRVSGLGLIISSGSSIHLVYFKKELNFKLLAMVGIFSTIVSGFISVTMAFNGFGVWSLVFSGLIQSGMKLLLLWIVNSQLIKFIFKLNILKEHFSFGSKIMLASFINVLYGNIYYLFIGKIYSSSTLGFYNKADGFQKLLSNNIGIIVRQVTYPVLSKLQENNLKLQENYRILIRFTSFVTFILLSGLFVVSESFVVVLIGIKWLPLVPMLKLLCFVGVLFPLISINTNILNVKGRSDLSLKIEVIKIILSIPTLILGYYFGIYIMIVGAIFSLILVYIVVMQFSNKVINYSIRDQLKDIFPTLKLILFSFTPTYFIMLYLNLPVFFELFTSFILSLTFLIIISEFFDNDEYNAIKKIVLKKINDKF